MGFLDKARKLAQQAKEFAEDQVEQRRQQGQQPDATSGDGGSSSSSGGGRTPKPPGTPAGELGERWKKLDLRDPAGVVPPKARDVAGVPKSTHSEVVKESYGIGRRWSAEGKSIGVFWLIDPDGSPTDAGATAARFDALRTPVAEDVPDVGEAAYVADLGNDRHGVFVKADGLGVVVEVVGIPREAALPLAQAAAANVRG